MDAVLTLPRGCDWDERWSSQESLAGKILITRSEVEKVAMLWANIGADIEPEDVSDFTPHHGQQAEDQEPLIVSEETGALGVEMHGMLPAAWSRVNRDGMEMLPQFGGHGATPIDGNGIGSGTGAYRGNATSGGLSEGSTGISGDPGESSQVEHPEEEATPLYSVSQGKQEPEEAATASPDSTQARGFAALAQIQAENREVDKKVAAQEAEKAGSALPWFQRVLARQEETKTDAPPDFEAMYRRIVKPAYMKDRIRMSGSDRAGHLEDYIEDGSLQSFTIASARTKSGAEGGIVKGMVSVSKGPDGSCPDCRAAFGPVRPRRCYFPSGTCAYQA